MVDLFNIEFTDARENPWAVYKPGQNVLFNVHLALAEPMKCRSVTVQIFGGSDVKFSESQGKYNNTYSSNEVYINQQQQILVTQTEGPHAGCHPAGEYFYPLWFTLPNTAPSSYQDTYGSIRYYISAIIDRPWMIDSRVKKFFTVIHDLDLNEKPVDLVGPYQTDDEDEQNVFMDAGCCCKMCCGLGCGEIVVNLRLNKRGFVPGEHIQITGDIHNRACTSLSMASIQLLQKTVYHADGHIKICDRVAASVELPGIPSGQRLQLNHRMAVPPVVASYIPGCKNIEVNYTLRAVARNCGCEIAKLDCCQIIVGTVPLRSVQHQPLELMTTPSAPLMWSPPPSAPPSYCECVFGRMQIQDTDEQGQSSRQKNQWAPSYPVYQFSG